MNTDNFFETSVNKIKSASKNNKLVIFVGAGVSANSGFPTWKELIVQMSKDLGGFDGEISSDLFTKIPQYYFNERGEKEYFEILTKIFQSKKYKPTVIHDEILKLNPMHLITTNYDDLLEQAALINGHFYHKISNDLDLPYNNFNKKIIKMHGDFDIKNIVLKEDDYLNYSHNFTLIENYIKSLISTNTILFIGYSVNDPNFNLIFNWVKNSMKNHFQPAYLIESYKDYSRMEYSYYKNRGINILYSSEVVHLRNKEFEEDNKHGNNLYDILKHINLTKSSNNNDLEKIYERLNQLEKLKFIMPEQIIDVLDFEELTFDIFGQNELFIHTDNSSLLNIFLKENREEKNILFKKIIGIIRKSNISSIQAKNHSEIFNLSTEFENDYVKDLVSRTINNSELLKTIERSSKNYFNSDDYMQMLEHAYNLYRVQKYYEAYDFYKTISLKAFQDKEYLVYYISEFNRKHVSVYFKNSVNRDSDLSVDKINIKEIYDNLPNDIKSGMNFLEELNDLRFIYKTLYNINKEVKDLKEMKYNVENGGISLNQALQKLNHQIKNIWLFLESNYFVIDKYLDVKELYYRFIEGVIVSYSTKKEVLNKNDFGNFPLNNLKKFGLFEVHIMISQLSVDRIEKLLSEYNIKKIEIDDEGKSYLINNLTLLTEDLKTNRREFKELEDIKNNIYKILIVTSKVKLSKKEFNDVVWGLLPLMNERVYFNELKYLNEFLIFHTKSKDLTKKNLKIYIEKYIKLYFKKPMIIDFDQVSFFDNLTFLAGKHDDFKINEKILDKIISKTEHKIDYTNLVLYRFFNEIVITMYTFFTDNQKEKILNVIKSILKNSKKNEFKLSKDFLIMYLNLVSKKIIMSDDFINCLIIESAVKLAQDDLQNKNYDSNTVNNISESPVDLNELELEIELELDELKIELELDLEFYLNLLTNLYRNKGLNFNEFNQHLDLFFGHSSYFDLLFNFDNDKFEIDDFDKLLYLNHKELDRVTKNKKNKERINSWLKEKMKNQSNKNYSRVLYKLYLD